MTEEEEKQREQSIKFKKTLEAIKTTHKLTTRKICEYTMSYRPWVTKFILPFLDKIYIPSGLGKNSKSATNWAAMLKYKYGFDSFESSYYRTSDFQELLEKSLISSTRQTISISISMLAPEKNRKQFLESFVPVYEEYDSLKNSPKKDWEKMKKLRAELHRIAIAYIKKEHLKELENCNKMDRKLTPTVPCTCNWDFTKFTSLHDRRGYGGVDELVYRNFFEIGAIRMEFHFTAKNGDKGKKIFYYYDEEENIYRPVDGSPKVYFPYQYFIEHIKD